MLGRCMSRLIFLLPILIGLLVSLACPAQTAIPGVIDPGRMKQGPEAPTTSREDQPRTPRIDTSRIVPPEEAKNIHFELKNIHLRGVTVYSKDELRHHYVDLLDSEVSLSDIYEVIDSIIQQYRRDDYALVSALIPSQDFSNGDIEIRFVEGHVAELRLAEDLEFSQDEGLLESGQLARYANNIKSEKPLTKKTLRRNLLLANDVPGIRVDGNFLRSETEAGAVDVGLKVKQEQFETFGSIDNYGPEELGPTQFQVGATYNSLFRVGDSTGITVGGTPDLDTLRYAFFKHSQIVGANGLRLGIDLGYLETKPDIPGIEGLEGEAKVASFNARYPWLRGLRENLFFYGSLDYVDSDNAFLQRTISSDSVRSLRLGTLYNNRDDWYGNNTLNLSVSQGLDIMGASGTSRPNGEIDYTKLNFFLQRTQEIGKGFSAELAVSGQYSFSKLLASEEYGYGGREFGRAFRPSEISGDHGLAGSLELRYSSPGVSVVKRYEPYLFADAGKIWRRDERFIFRQLSGASAGGGLRLSFTEFFTLEIELAKSIHESVDQIGDEDFQFFIRLTGES